MFDVLAIIKTVGYLGLFGIIFAESGLMIGFFLPGDSLLFAAGFLASQGVLNIAILLPLLFCAAVVGDNLGYWIGKKTGKKIFKKEDSLFFHKNHLVRARIFFEKHGPKAIILARFIPVIRAFAPVLAGVGEMKYRSFFIFNIAGGLLWAVAIPLLGFYLGSAIPNIDAYLLPIILLIMISSLIPSIIHFLKKTPEPATAGKEL
jgi:membrane-associated protein